MSEYKEEQPTVAVPLPGTLPSPLDARVVTVSEQIENTHDNMATQRVDDLLRQLDSIGAAPVNVILNTLLEMEGQMKERKQLRIQYDHYRNKVCAAWCGARALFG